MRPMISPVFVDLTTLVLSSEIAAPRIQRLRRGRARVTRLLESKTPASEGCRIQLIPPRKYQHWLVPLPPCLAFHLSPSKTLAKPFCDLRWLRFSLLRRVAFRGTAVLRDQASKMIWILDSCIRTGLIWPSQPRSSRTAWLPRP